MSDRPPQPPASTGAEPEIPPFQEPHAPQGSLRAIAQLFLIPAVIVAVAVGIFLAMNFLVGSQKRPAEILQAVATGDSRRRGQAAFELSKRIVANPALLDDAGFRGQLLALYQRSSGNAELRRYLTVCLSKVKDLSDSPEAVAALLGATGDPDPQTRVYAVVALGNARAIAALPRLLELCGDPDKGIRLVAVASLANLGDPAAIPPLAARLEDPAADVTWHAAIALARLGSDAGEGVLDRLLEPAYLTGQPGVTQAGAQELMRMAVAGLGQLQARAPTPQRLALLQALAQQAPFLLVQEAARAELRALHGP
jgi:HEAT repeat protein